MIRVGVVVVKNLKNATVKMDDEHTLRPLYEQFLDTTMESYNQLLGHLVEKRVLKDDSPLLQAFTLVDRKDFIPMQYHNFAYEDFPISIGYRQSISQPSTIAFMLTKLDVLSGHTVLEVGYGSGWQTVILSILAGDSGKIHATELIPQLKEFGEHNIAKYQRNNIHLYQANKGDLGVPVKGPFDRIIVGAAGTHIPQRLIDQLAVGGIMVIPVNYSIYKVEKLDDGRIHTEEFPNYIFVPLIT